MIVPTEPEDLHHTRAAAQALIAVLPGARVAAGTPVAPSPSFAKERSVFAASMRLALHAVDARD